MIGNRYLQQSFNENDIGWSMNELGEICKQNSDKFKLIIKECDLDSLTIEEKDWLTKVSCYIAVLMIDIRKEPSEVIPLWLFDDKLRLDNLFVFGARSKDIYRLKLILGGTPSMKYKNVYFHMSSFCRV